ncbi:MAG: hypothetical protein Kow0090_01340 [Myxococcota bacterium]
MRPSGAKLAKGIGRLLRELEMTLVTAESCTGGLLGKLITDTAGSSDYYRGGVVVYSNELKIKLLGVTKRILEKEGAVSEGCAKAMARGARRRLGGDLALAITGVAGPTGGSGTKPVGTVYIALATPEEVFCERYDFKGGRAAVRNRSALAALALLVNYIGKKR